MTKKDYQALAGAIYQARRGRVAVSQPCKCIAESAHPHSPASIVAILLADALAADSPRFDRERFLRACETGEMGKVPR